MLAPVTFDCSIRLCCETEPGTALVLTLLPARTHQQQLAMERLRVRGATAQSVFTDAASATRYLHVVARGGVLAIELHAQVRLLQAQIGGPGLGRDVHVDPLGAPESMRFLLPSRHCPSDRLAAVAEREFLSVDPPFERAVAIDRFIRRHLRVRRDAAGVQDTSDVAPDAVEVLGRAEGTPRDLAHLMIALCRASRLPARYVTTVPYGLPDATGVSAWVEVLVGDAWLAVDPSRTIPRTALLRLGTGRDAADVPLALAHGTVSRLRVDGSIACPDTSAATLVARDLGAAAIVTATLGSLGEATRWHQEARLAARRRGRRAEDAEDAEPGRAAPSRIAAAAARAAATVPRTGAQVLVFPVPSVPGAPRVAGEPAGSRTEPV